MSLTNDIAAAVRSFQFDGDPVEICIDPQVIRDMDEQWSDGVSIGLPPDEALKLAAAIQESVRQVRLGSIDVRSDADGNTL